MVDQGFQNKRDQKYSRRQSPKMNSKRHQAKKYEPTESDWNSGRTHHKAQVSPKG